VKISVLYVISAFERSLMQWCSTRVRLEYLFWGLGLGLGLEPKTRLEVFRNWTQHCMTWN